MSKIKIKDSTAIKLFVLATQMFRPRDALLARLAIARNICVIFNASSFYGAPVLQKTFPLSLPFGDESDGEFCLTCSWKFSIRFQLG